MMIGSPRVDAASRGGVDLGEVDDNDAAIGGLRSGKIDEHIPGS